MTEFEKLGGTYRQVGDYYLPNLEIDNQIKVQIGVWGQRHRRFLKENHRVRYYNLLTTGTLNDYSPQDIAAFCLFPLVLSSLKYTPAADTLL